MDKKTLLLVLLISSNRAVLLSRYVLQLNYLLGTDDELEKQEENESILATS